MKTCGLLEKIKFEQNYLDKKSEILAFRRKCKYHLEPGHNAIQSHTSTPLHPFHIIIIKQKITFVMKEFRYWIDFSEIPRPTMI